VAPEPREAYLASVGRDPDRLKIASITSPMLAHAIDPECRKALDDAAWLLEGLGHIVEEREPPIDYGETAAALIVLFLGEITQAMEIAEGLVGHRFTRREIELFPWFARAYFRSRTPQAVAHALYVQGKLARQFAAFMAEWDILLMPTLGLPPIPIGGIAPNPAESVMIDIASATRFGPLFKLIIKELGAKVFAWTPSTPVFNITGQPGMSVPLHWSAAGLPVGVQFIGRYGDETTLFQLAGQLERARPWFDKRPKVAA